MKTITADSKEKLVFVKRGDIESPIKVALGQNLSMPDDAEIEEFDSVESWESAIIERKGQKFFDEVIKGIRPDKPEIPQQ